MPLDLTKKENVDDPMAQLRRADYLARINREMREWRKEFEKLYGSRPHKPITDKEKKVLQALQPKFQKVPDAQQPKRTDKKDPPVKIYGEEYFEGKK